MSEAIAAMPKYKAYKDSKIDWLSEIPSHWSAQKLKHLARVDNSGYYGVDPEIGELVYPVATTAQITSDGHFLVEKMSDRGFSKQEAERYLCRSGDVLVVKSSGSVSNVISGKAGMVAPDTPEFVFSNFLLRLVPNPKITSSSFLYYVVSSHLTRERINRMVAGSTYPNLQVPEYISALLPFPHILEQTAIAAFLDRKTAQIDQAVEIKAQQIELLKERKQILIQNAVTCGLNPDAPMRDSGIDWIGQIPVRWNVKPGLCFFSENKRSNKGMIEEQVLSLSYGRIVIKPKEKLVGLVPESFETYQIVEPGDIIVRCTDLQNDQTSLRTGLANDHGIITSAYLNLKVAKNQFPQYLHYFLHALDITKEIYKYGSGLRQNLGFGDFKRMAVLDVPLQEQREIVDHIETESAKIERAIDLQQQQIDKLKEYKATLINSAVTGKIRVV